MAQMVFISDSKEEKIDAFEILTPTQLNKFLTERLKLWKEETERDSQLMVCPVFY